MPAAAKGSSEAAAKAFVRYWIETLNYAGPSGDTQRLSELSHNSCSACRAVVDFIDQVHVNGGYIKGKGWSVRATDIVTFQPPRRPVIDALVAVHSQEVQTSPTDEPKTFVGGQRLKTFYLSHSKGGWVVTRLEQSR